MRYANHNTMCCVKDKPIHEKFASQKNSFVVLELYLLLL